MINGMVAGPDGRKMSKSYGNVVPPETVLQRYPADAMRQWGATGTLGEDFPFSWEECEHSNRFLTKLWNVAKFVEGQLAGYERPEKPPKLSITDRWMLSKLQAIVQNARDNLEGYTFNIPLQEIRGFVWHELADYYLEMVKHRLYKPEVYGEESKRAAQYTLSQVLETVLKLLAPIAPHITEEVYTELFKEKSVHLAEYPKADQELRDEKAEKACGLLIKIIDDVRKYKSDRSISLGAELETVSIETPDPEEIRPLAEDVKGTCRIKDLRIGKGGEFRIVF
jgi:valyl-tRNA synthetase